MMYIYISTPQNENKKESESPNWIMVSKSGGYGDSIRLEC